MSRGTALLLTMALAMAALTVRLSLRPPGEAPLQLSQAATVPGAATPPVRVLLGSPRGALTIRIDGPYRVAACGDWRVLAQGMRLPAVRVWTSEAGIHVGSDTFRADRLCVEVLEPATLWVENTRYRGSLRLIRQDAERIAAVNVVGLEDYIASVVNGEMPSDFPPAARQAQAIAARGYAMFHMKNSASGSDFDVFDSTRSQRYLGVEWVDAAGRRLAGETADSRQVAQATAGMVLTYRGRLFCAYYSAVCGGHTARGREVFAQAAPPLVGVSCPGCADAPRFRWQKELPRDECERKLLDHLAARGRSVGPLEQIEVQDRRDGSMPLVRVVGQRGEQVFKAGDLRRVVGPKQLPSPFFTLTVDDRSWRFDGRGWGHGVGLCQWGARGLARAGRTRGEILQHYYPACEITVVR